MIDLASNRPVGVFDSGVGGVSTLGALRHVLPSERFIYYGDTRHAPYGTKPQEEVLGYIRGVMAELAAQDVKAVVIACNTATAVAAASLRAELTLPIIGIEPALKPASEVRRSGQILVLATPVTLALPKFAGLMARYGEGAVRVPCPGLMELVEAEDFAAAERYLTDVLAPYDLMQVDALVLGCTHYVFLRPILSRLLPPHIQVMDGNLGTARQLARVLEREGLLNESGAGGVTFQTSGDAAVVVPQMERLLLRAERLMANAAK